MRKLTSTHPALEVSIEPARSKAEIDAIHRLFLEYAESLSFDLCFQNFDEELATLPGRYAPPSGELLLARVGSRIAGGVGLRGLNDGNACEMKRLYIRPDFRGLKLGYGLATAIIQSAQEAEYNLMRLDTLSSMTEAINLYRAMGFTEIAPYYDNPLAGAVYFEKKLAE